MPAVRPYWKGYIKLALVSCPIGLWAASSSSERVAFRQINKKTGNRLRQQLIDEETRIAVEAHDKGRGYEHAKGSYLMIEDHELEAIEIESNHTIEIDSFVPRAEIDERFLDSPYYVAPNEPVGQEAFAVIREAMRGKDMVALGRVVLSKRERVLHDTFVKLLDDRSRLDISTIAHDQAHGGHDVSTFTILRHDPIHAVALTLLLEALSDHCGADLLRLKGIVNILESPDQPAVIHGVQLLFHPPSWLPRWPSDDRRSRIVFITRGLPRRWVEVLLDAIDAEVAVVSSGR